ncbi:MAG: rRNA maturation RNase YbeY [Alcaligenaceae bacterium]|nr:rRNA maturation RNase YbeY [Alcaligenaceae bacterium]
MNLLKLSSQNLHVSVQYGIDTPVISRQQIRAWLFKALQYVPEIDQVQSVEFNIRWVDANEGRLLNRDFRAKDYPTNVLTFEYGIDPMGHLCTDVVLCLPVIEKEANEQGKTLKSHTAHLLVHGMLHAFSYDHIEDNEAEEMESLEIMILQQLGFSNPYKERQING